MTEYSKINCGSQPVAEGEESHDDDDTASDGHQDDNQPRSTELVLYHRYNVQHTFSTSLSYRHENLSRMRTLYWSRLLEKETLTKEFNNIFKFNNLRNLQWIFCNKLTRIKLDLQFLCQIETYFLQLRISP